MCVGWHLRTFESVDWGLLAALGLKGKTAEKMAETWVIVQASTFRHMKKWRMTD